MSQATITSKGQITIPAKVREGLKVASGDKVAFIDLGEGRYELVAITRDIRSLKGVVKSDSVVSLEQMQQAIRQAASR